MNSFKLTTAIVFASMLAALGSAVATVDAEVIFQDNFEGRTAGDSLSAALPQVGAAYEATVGTARDITTTPPGSVPFGGSIFVQGGNLENDHWWSLTTAGAAATVGNTVRFDFDLYMVAGYGEAYVDVITFTDTSYSNRGFDINILNNGAISVYNGSSVLVDGTYATDTWQHVAIVADYGNDTFSATVGSLSFSGGMNGATSFNVVELYTQTNGDTGYFYDNVVINVIPEPGTLTLLTMGLVGLLAYAWRKRK